MNFPGVKEVTFFSNSKSQQRLSTIEYTAIGISSILLALIYIASVSLYLHSRKTKKKSLEAPEVTLTGGRRGAGLVKNNPLLGTSRHFESDSALSESDLGDDLPQSDGEPRFENVHVRSSKLNSNLYHYKFTIISTFKQNYDSKFQEFKTIYGVFHAKSDGFRTRGVQKDSIFDPILASVECRIFDIRSALLHMSDFRHSISRPSNFEYSTSETPFFGCRIFDIRTAVR